MAKFTYHITEDKYNNRRVYRILVFNFITKCTTIKNKHKTGYLSNIQSDSITSIPTWSASTESKRYFEVYSDL